MKLVNVIAICGALLVPASVYAEDFVDQVGQGVSDAAVGVGNAAEDVGGAVSDSAVTTQVKAQLALSEDVPSGISVTTVDGTVHLIGVVNSQAQLDRVVAITRDVMGVKGVDASKLQIK